MHTPSAVAARPLPKRTRSTAGLEEIDAWLGQITNSSTTTTTSTATSSAAVVRDARSTHGASRKRHHSLPTTSLAGSLQSLPSGSEHPKSHGKSSASMAGRRPELALFAGDALPPASQHNSPFSNQYSPSLHHDAHAIDTSYGFVQQPLSNNALPPPLQLPEMSPREDFLVRAFVSDAMKLEPGVQDDGAVAAFALLPPRTTSYHATQRPPEIHTPTTDDRSFDAVMTPTGAATPTPPMLPTPRSGGVGGTAQGSHQKWTREEDEKLRDAVTRFGGKSWKLIAEMLGNGRTDVQCLHRWNKVLKPGLVKGPWTPEEDRILLNLIARHGVGQIRWCDVALHLPGRIGKQCRERWCNHLDSTIRKGQWTPQEDDTVFRLQQTIGNKWSEIAKHLPGRTENAVKNRFNSAARRKWLMSQATAASSGLVSPPMVPVGKSSRLHHTQPPLGPQGARAPPLARTSGGLLSTDLLAGPPRPPPPPPAPTTTSLRGVSFGGSSVPLQGPAFPSLDGDTVFRSVLESSPPLTTFGDMFHTAPAGHAFLSPPEPPTPSELRPAFSFHPSNAFPATGAHFRPQLHATSSVASPTLASLTALLSTPSSSSHEKKVVETEALASFTPQHQDALDGLAMDDDADDRHHGDEDNQVNHSPPRRGSIGSTTATQPSGQIQKRRLSMDTCAGTPRGPSLVTKLADPQEDDDDDHDALRAMDFPDSATEAQQADEARGGSSPVDMDDQNMSTFLDSVALELEDMI